jgi:holo-[acyl-carrier protein] synthase
MLASAERAALPAHPVRFLAARFAAKEAASKALGTGFSAGVTLSSIEVEGGERGKPLLKLHGQAKIRADELGVTRYHVSLTHGRDVAAAVVVLEREE